MKTYYNQAVESWLYNRGKTFDIYAVAEAAGVAYPKAFTPQNILSGFHKSGIYPLDTEIFTDDEEKIEKAYKKTQDDTSLQQIWMNQLLEPLLTLETNVVAQILPNLSMKWQALSLLKKFSRIQKPRQERNQTEEEG
ncbi:hypothetical protein ANN_02801 [Periplaneta americana]|uniref:Uncharacterized protein n=1 Tax=Periplaneta americana TaxID=6978 RepID=A0ABQ8U0W4_PERAM|nr:hypothetical protein ANN_02801 [Periplaneta americana]